LSKYLIENLEPAFQNCKNEKFQSFSEKKFEIFFSKRFLFKSSVFFSKLFFSTWFTSQVCTLEIKYFLLLPIDFFQPSCGASGADAVLIPSKGRNEIKHKDSTQKRRRKRKEQREMTFRWSFRFQQ
jgi:hypothetical protein